MKQVKSESRYNTHDEFDQFTLHLDDEAEVVVTKREVKKSKEPFNWSHVGLAGDLGFTIAVPIAGGAIAGMLIDRYWSSYPTMTLSLLLFGIIVSIAGFVRVIRDFLKPKA